MQLTALERAILGAYHEAYACRGFPDPGQVRAVERELTEKGTFTHLRSKGQSALLPDWECALPNGQGLCVTVDGGQVELGVKLYMVEGRPATLEIFRANGHGWNGKADTWELKTVLLIS